MNPRLRYWQLAAIVVLVCVAAVGGTAFYYRWQASRTQWFLQRLPDRDAIVCVADVRALRASGILEAIAGSRTAEEEEYRDFVAQSGFDYRTDLDFVAVSFARNQTYLLARGRFHWGQLRAYAQSRLGRCLNSFCQIPGSSPDRNVSFAPAAPGVIALSVGREPAGAWFFRDRGHRTGAVAGSPLWVSFDGAWVGGVEAVPDGLRSFTSALRGARRVVVAVLARDGRLEFSLDATMGTPGEAEQLKLRLDEVTRLLKSMLARQNMAPNPSDLSGVLSGGEFLLSGNQVHGRWPVEQAFFDAVLRERF